MLKKSAESLFSQEPYNYPEAGFTIRISCSRLINRLIDQYFTGLVNSNTYDLKVGEILKQWSTKMKKKYVRYLFTYQIIYLQLIFIVFERVQFKQIGQVVKPKVSFPSGTHQGVKIDDRIMAATLRRSCGTNVQTNYTHKIHK